MLSRIYFNKIAYFLTLIKNTTQRGQQIIRAYENAKHDDIHKAYGKPSSHKVDAFNKIKKEMELVKGTNIRITGAGSDYFSCAYKAKSDDGKTYIIYHTHIRVYAVEIE